MRKAPALIAATFVAFAGCSPAAFGQSVTVQRVTMPGVPTPTHSWSPSVVTVAPGSIVTFVNATGGGGAPHDLVWGDGAPGFPAMTPPTGNMAAWMSPRTFSGPGDYSFVCTFHPITMTGVVHVAAPATPAPAPGTGTAQPGAPAADTTAPALTSATAKATRRRVTLRLRLGEAARITVVVATRSGRTLARKRFTRRAAGPATLRVPLRARSGRLTIRVTAVDAAGNTSRRTLRIRVR